MIAVLFEAEVTPASQERYLALAAELKPLLSNIDGFIAIERFQSLSTAGKILSLSWWRDEDAVLAWKRNLLPSGCAERGAGEYFRLLSHSGGSDAARIPFFPFRSPVIWLRFAGGK
ncbi:antibiotic biosynthesis monooxygenase [Klebsiella grimontii]|nr:antibiotic biosynthesis monooxygenase [Klebsiella grimontii]